MKRAPLLLSVGTVAGFIGVLGFHNRQAPVAVVGPRVGGGQSAASPSAVGPTPAGPSAGNGAVRSAVGPAEQFGYGVLDVKVTASGTSITDVSVPMLQTAEPTSQQISQEAIAMLRAEVMSTHSATIDAISGATYTSEAYIQSLQAAVDKLHA